MEESSDDKHEMGETSIYPRVKKSKEKSNTNMEALSTITHGDRPSIGMVAAHWNQEEPSQISPKWWDGNGIPNSTNKYKEVLSCFIQKLLGFFTSPITFIILKKVTFLDAGPESELGRNQFRGEIRESPLRRK